MALTCSAAAGPPWGCGPPSLSAPAPTGARHAVRGAADVERWRELSTSPVREERLQVCERDSGRPCLTEQEVNERSPQDASGY